LEARLESRGRGGGFRVDLREVVRRRAAVDDMRLELSLKPKAENFKGRPLSTQ
jgi:hypothetical protein